MLFDCFKKKPKVEVKEPTLPINIFHDGIDIAFVRGHTKSSSGADNYLGESEFVWAGRIAKKCQEKLAVFGVKTAILERPDGRSYTSQCDYIARKCEELKAEYSVHLHFNAASGNPLGCEVLVTNKMNETALKFGDYFTDQLNEKHGFSERRADGIKILYRGHNGYGMLNAVEATGTIPMLIEPCFANWRNAESIMVFENEDAFIDILVDACLKMVKLELPERTL